MSYSRSDPLPALPPWLTALGSTALVAHFAALAVLVLSAPTGPWPLIPLPPERLPGPRGTG